MKKIFLLVALTFVVLMVYAQETTKPPTGFEGISRTRAGQEEAIESARPDIVIIEAKMDTEVKPIYFNFNTDLLRSTNRILLIKWLKESK
ncbi:MAG: hypothetical protein PHI68_08840 [Candidatus Cloacimonetes bacterium]|nr:hypothetical protein [Candidatus Cloacimonadota bacterium]